MRRLKDAGVLADCARCVQETVKAFGGIDIIIGNACSIKITQILPCPRPPTPVPNPPLTLIKLRLLTMLHGS